MRRAAPSLLLLALLTLGGCRQDAPSASAEPGAGTDTALGRTIRQATDKARSELASHNMKISSTGQPTAEITPQGDLLVSGEPVPVNQEQRALLLAYRAELVEIASAGIDIGAEGANLGLRAAGQALRSVLSGNPEEAGKQIEAEAETIKAAARRLCDRIPALRARGQAVAASLPAFAPYATIDPADADKCMKDTVADAGTP